MFGLPNALVSMDARQVARVARGIRRAAPEAWAATRVQLRAIGDTVAGEVRANASFSTKVPGSVRTSVTRGGNVRVTIGGAKAPAAVALENKGKGHPRHPLPNDNRSEWFTNRTPPFLLPAFANRQAWALEEIERTYLDVFERVFERGV